ncbi:MAG: sterol desaturase family protein [Myxococcaceae bacterium]|nr:sterol desaturase family protein [Myxococcaceae bacterium]
MDSLWSRLTSSGPGWAWFVPALFTVHVVSYWGTYAVFQAMHRAGVWAKWRVANGTPPSEALMKKLYGRAIVSTLSFGGAAFVVYGALTLRGVDFSAPLPAWWTVAWQLPVFALVTDTTFYWLHRTLHRPFWFRRIHRLHHDFRYVRGLSAEYSNTLEDLGNFITSFAGPVLLGAHPFTVLVWFFLRMLETVDAHSGYAVPWSPWASRHAYHHEFNRGCFGAFFALWDRALGTDKDWRAWKAKQAEPAKQPVQPAAS